MQLKLHMIMIEDLMPQDHFLRKLEAALEPCPLRCFRREFSYFGLERSRDLTLKTELYIQLPSFVLSRNRPAHPLRQAPGDGKAQTC